ncbi:MULTISPECIES: transcription antitermination factor NusB [Eubacteriales]|uniref:transcription antitermination factor NusB n=1 Tax=Eubacteriales TaxID=186802 RepID=UPI000B389716|nr:MULTISPECIES: transcription antitermination factor NusB [Eubacteriales]MDY4167688.1 transcription antitermination factor NusB [Fournierella sp.]OUN85733.1 transcription antitermination factor NusB [Gemmiger sp. An50]OUP25015.1 transcription antitermination factor NusB [Gemmiger sp. An194]
MEKLTRRTARENAFLAAFASTFDNAMPEDVIALNNELGENRVDEFGRKLIDDYYEHSAEINDMIRDHLKGWTIDRIPRVSLTVLRLALSEILYGEEKLPSVTINEAVELTKKFGGNEDYQFVNGLLGSVVRELGLADQDSASE